MESLSKKKLLEGIASREHAYNILSKKFEDPHLSSRACSLDYFLNTLPN
jgi:hypothetical protein